MGYTHYWRRAPDLDRAAFIRAMDDVRVIIAACQKRGLLIAGPHGSGIPELNDFIIAFNGGKECGHRYLDLGEPWPSAEAEGVEAVLDPVVGPWFSGARLATRVCGGRCSGKPFVVERKFLVRPWDQLERGGYFSHCETGFKPYDLAVTSALVRLKERLGDEIRISSDGQERGFAEAKQICRELFGWESRFELEPEESEVV